MGIAYPKGPGTFGPPKYINYYILWIGCQDYHLGKLNSFIYQLKYNESRISQESRDLGSPKPY